MTATPIPRTLTLAQYGEMDVSKLDEMPPGRQAIDTRVVALERLGEVVDGLARHLDSGRQAYWVCPMVRENETDDLAAAEARYRLAQGALRRRRGAGPRPAQARAQGRRDGALRRAARPSCWSRPR